MKSVYVNGRLVRLDPTRSIGKGFEADVYDIGGGMALKVFKPPDHPDFTTDTDRQAAAARIHIHQQKLRDFPAGLPDRVVTPQQLAFNRSGGRIVGYTMRLLAGMTELLRYADRNFRETAVPNETVISTFRDLHRTVSQLHARQVVIGDFNDLNVLADNRGAAFLIDTDSYQFGRYPCPVFMLKFTDPLLLAQGGNGLALNGHFTPDSDWYAFAVMLMQSLLFVDPYGGIHRPVDPSLKVPHALRPLQRLTVFHPDVVYPKPAVLYETLPDELLDRFQRIFTSDERGVFPLTLVESLRWTRCTVCGTTHARPICPVCRQAGRVKEVVRVRGQVTARRIFACDGIILAAAVQNGQLGYLYHEGGNFWREGERTVAKGPVLPQMRFGLSGQRTLMASGGRLVILEPGAVNVQHGLEQAGNRPVMTASSGSILWVNNGQLQRQGALGPEYVGDVLANQTLIWTGDEFGFGFYRAGRLTRAFVFDPRRRGINDSVNLPPLSGQLLDAAAVFSSRWCWFFTTSRTGSQTVNVCHVIDRHGRIIASATQPADDPGWLAVIRGHAAVGDFLLTPTDAGIVRVETTGSQLAVTRTFPDTEPFVGSDTELLAGTDGLYAVGRRTIHHLTIK